MGLLFFFCLFIYTTDAFIFFINFIYLYIYLTSGAVKVRGIIIHYLIPVGTFTLFFLITSLREFCSLVSYYFFSISIFNFSSYIQFHHDLFFWPSFYLWIWNSSTQLFCLFCFQPFYSSFMCISWFVYGHGRSERFGNTN